MIRKQRRKDRIDRQRGKHDAMAAQEKKDGKRLAVRPRQPWYVNDYK
jgi:hypothetical protein